MQHVGPSEAPRACGNARRAARLGDPVWHQGQTENISHTGALFNADNVLPIDTRVEFRLVLSTAARGDKQHQHPEVVFGLGSVVRTTPDEDVRHGFAVAIERYVFLPVPPVAQAVEHPNITNR